MPNGAVTSTDLPPPPQQGTGGITIALGAQPQGNTLLLPRPAPNELALPPPQGAPGTTGTTTTPSGQTYADAISGHEGTGQNIHSSAFGYGQFIKPTWLSYAQAHPEKFQGMSEEQILAKRSDPAYGTDATNWLAGENAKELQRRGITPSGQSLGIAHYLGAAPAAAVMSAADTDPVSKFVSPEALAANKELTTMTVGQMKARYAGTPNPGFLGGTSTATTTAPPAQQVASPQPKNPLALQTPPMPDMHKMWTMAMLATLLPKGFTFQPVDFHPFQAAKQLGQSRVPGVDWGGFQRAKVVMGQASPAIAPQNVPQFARASVRRSP